MRIDAMNRCRAIVAVLVACSLGAAGGAAQGDPWGAPVRGSWVRTGPVASGDVVLAAGASGAEIVLGAAEHLSVRQAGTFLAGDIEAISGYRPPILARPPARKKSIPLCPVGDQPLPGADHCAALRRQVGVLWHLDT